MAAPTFEQALVLQDFLAATLGGNPLDPGHPTHALRDVPPGSNPSGPSPYLEAFLALRRPVPGIALPEQDLEAYDRDVATLTDGEGGINASRPAEPIRWLYFQWVALMHSAVYLDAFFRDPDDLLRRLNAHLGTFNEARKLALPAYTAEDLRRFSLWLATGAGKTLLLHANLHQHRAYRERHGAPEPKHTLLLVPTDALARQHVSELKKSGIRARVYRKGDGDLLGRLEVLVLVITHVLDPDPSARSRRKPKDGEVLYEASLFGRRNLLLVDEGHRGKEDDGTWRQVRRYLGEEGFTFEYSATLKEVARPGLAALTREAEDGQGAGAMAREYARSIAVDYAFRRFHHDGYGKHFRVLSLATGAGGDRASAMDAYLTGCLLAFYEQMMVFEEDGALVREHRVERPLAVFAGLRVAGEGSEVLQSISLLGRFLAERERFEAVLKSLLAGTLVVRDRKGGDAFAGMFGEARRVHGEDAPGLHAAMVRRLFLAEGPSRLRAARRKDAEGEVQLRVGEGEPFAVVNVGEPAEVLKELEKPAHRGWVQVEPDITGGSLFDRLGDAACRTTMLIGSRKFMEGWNCFRVSMLGIHSIGKSAGTQIVQLFGRGVRLRGRDGSLRRASTEKGRGAPGSEVEKLRVLETISLFTVNAAYMAEFERDVNEALGGDSEGDVVVESIPIVGQDGPPHLRMLKFPEPKEFRRDAAVVIGPDATRAADGRRPVVDVDLDYYPRAGSQVSAGAAGGPGSAGQHVVTTLSPWLDLLDHDALYAQCVRLRNEKQWHNLKLPRFVDDGGGGRIPLTLWLLRQEPSWFRVRVEGRLVDPEAVPDLGLLPLWQRLAAELVRAYVAESYGHHLRAWQTLGAKVVWWRDLGKDGDSLVPEGHFTKDGAQHRVAVTVREGDGGRSQAVLEFVKEVAAAVRGGDWSLGRRHGLRPMGTAFSLYRPLLALADGPVTIQCQPVALNTGEERFLDAVERFLDTGPPLLEDARVRVLRNESRRGLGFFVDVGFYPDFVLWIEKGERQWVIFVDPKGATHMATRRAAAKLRLPEVLWEIERRNGLADVRLDAFLLFGTPEKDMDQDWLRGLGERGERVLFASQPDHVERMFARVMAR